MTTSTLFLVGATHRSATFGFREKIALDVLGEASLAVALRRCPGVTEFVILNTCNRVELYVIGTSHQVIRAVVDIFCTERGIRGADFEQCGFTKRDCDVVSHLCEVAAGLDSQILGETEIFGQVKKAYATAQTRGTAGAILNRLFQKAFQSAKHVRSTTGISTGQVSVANVAVDLANAVFGELASTRLLIVGAGDMAEKSGRAFQSRGTRSICVANRHTEKADALAQELAGSVVSFEDRDARLVEADIVVCSTSCPTAVISAEAVARAMRCRPSRPLLLIDLAMPRDIEATAGGAENVFLYNLDDLALVAAQNRDARLAHATAGRSALVERTAALWTQLQLQLSTLAAHPACEPVFVSPSLA